MEHDQKSKIVCRWYQAILFCVFELLLNVERMLIGGCSTSVLWRLWSSPACLIRGGTIGTAGRATFGAAPIRRRTRASAESTAFASTLSSGATATP